MKRKAVVVWRSCISSRPDKLNEASIYKLFDVLAGGSLFDTKSFHLKRRKSRLPAASLAAKIYKYLGPTLKDVNFVNFIAVKR